MEDLQLNASRGSRLPKCQVLDSETEEVRPRMQWSLRERSGNKAIIAILLRIAIPLGLLHESGDVCRQLCITVGSILDLFGSR